MISFSDYLREQKELTLNPLPYKDTDLQPVMSKETIDYHYSNLAAGYVKKYNEGKGDPVFNRAGAFLHNIFFPQLMPSKKNNNPTGKVLNLIRDNYQTFANFKKEFEKVAMSIQGSGWVYLAKDGKIKTIKNHQVKNDIVLLIDWWEHAWALDYQSDKGKYLNNIWSIINWDKVNEKL